jgi:hypothetical protein
MSSSFSKILVTALVLFFAGGVAAERMDDTTAPVIPNLPTLSRSSEYIFSGTVAKVECLASSRKDAVEVMRITFEVDDAIRGVSPGQKLVIREWAGLWQSGERYRPGERVMLFLYAPSKLGLTSPVGGAMGHLHISPDGRIVVPRGPLRPPTPRSPETAHPVGPNLVTLRELANQLRRVAEDHR